MLIINQLSYLLQGAPCLTLLHVCGHSAGECAGECDGHNFHAAFVQWQWEIA